MNKKDLFSQVNDMVNTMMNELVSDELYHMPLYTTEQNDSGYILKFKVAGASKDKIVITVNNSLIDVKIDATENFNGLHDKVWIPENVSLENTTAKYLDGILTINMPFIKGDRDLTKIEVQ